MVTRIQGTPRASRDSVPGTPNARPAELKAQQTADGDLTPTSERPEPAGDDGPARRVDDRAGDAAERLRDQAIVVLRHWEDQSVATVAKILRISVSAVKMRDARALSRIRALLGEDFAGS